jgi:hypothetical protein
MPESTPPRLAELLRRGSLWGALGLGAVVFSAAIRSPYMLDDFLHSAMVRGTYPGPRGPFDLYNFVDDGNRSELVADGIVPWWTHAGLVIRFFRPLSSLLRWGDLHLLSATPLLQHVHSFVWWVLAVVAVRSIARRCCSPRASTIATFVFALSPCHTIPLAWLANREALVSLALGAFALDAYARWRDAYRPRLALAATALFALALLSGEYAIGFGGYVVAIELVRRKDGVGRRVVGLAPFAVPLAVYLFFHVRGAYGVVGSGFYLDPFVDARPFLVNAGPRLAQLLLDAWWTIDGRVIWVPGWMLAVELLLAAAAIAVPLKRALAALDDSARSTAAWLVVGSVLSLAPALAVLPSVRLLGVAMIGVSVAVGLVLDRAWFPSEKSPRRGVVEVAELLAVGLAFSHLVRAPVDSWLGARAVRAGAVEYATRMDALRFDDPRDAAFVIPRSTSPQALLFAPFMFDGGRLPPPAHFYVLSMSGGHVLALRDGPTTLTLVSGRDTSLFPWPDDLFRRGDAPMRIGEQLEVPGMHVTIVDADDHGVHRARFVFDEALFAKAQWLGDDGATFQALALPAAGFGAPLPP